MIEEEKKYDLSMFEKSPDGAPDQDEKEYDFTMFEEKKKDTTGFGDGSSPDLEDTPTVYDEFVKQQLDLLEPAVTTATTGDIPDVEIPELSPMSMETFDDIVSDIEIDRQAQVIAKEDKLLFEEFSKAREKLLKSAKQDELKEKRKEDDQGIFKQAPEEIKEKFESGELTQADFHPDGNYFYGYLKNMNMSTSSFLRKINGAEKLVAKGLNIASGGLFPESEGVLGSLADWVDAKTVNGLPDVPKTIVGGSVAMFGHMNMFPVELFLTPQARMKVLSRLTGGLINGIPKLPILLGVGGGLEEYSISGDAKESFVRGVHGFSDGMFLHMLGMVAGKAGITSANNPLYQQLAASGINAVGFGGKSVYEQITTTGEIDWIEAGGQATFAVVLSAPEITKMAGTVFTSTKSTIRSANNMKVDYKKLAKEYEKLTIEESKPSTSAERKGEIAIAKQGMQDFVSMKFAIHDISQNPEKYRKIVENDKTLNKHEKKFQLDKIKEIEKLKLGKVEDPFSKLQAAEGLEKSIFEAEKALEADKKPQYIIEGKNIENKELFLKEVSKYTGKDKSPKIEVKNDEKTVRDVEDILANKKGVKDALLEDKVIQEGIAKEKETAEKIKDGRGKSIQVKEEEIKLLEQERDAKVASKDQTKGLKEEYTTKIESKRKELDVIKEEFVAETSKAQVLAHKEEGGSTITDKGENLSGTDKFAVSIYPDRKVEITGRNITEQQLADFRMKNKDLLSKEGHVLGTWYDVETGKSVIDISVAKPDLNEALALGRKYDQKEVWDLSKGAGVKYGEIADKVEKKPIGSKSTSVSRTFEESKRDISDPKKKTTKNSWIRQSISKDNKDRVLMVQFASDFMKGEYATDPVSEKYYDKLYRTRKGYDKNEEFWEVPHWIANAAKALPKSDVYVVRDIAEANKFFKESGYKTAAFSALDVNKDFIKEFAKNNPNLKLSVGGYVDFAKEFSGSPNVKTYGSIKELTTAMGERSVEGYDYRHFKGSKMIPRLKMSEGCKHRCAFCSPNIPRKVKSVSKTEIDRQIKSMKDLDAKLIYLDDKTFGQAENYKYLEQVYNEVKKNNPNFDGFIIQTTATQLNKISSEFIKKTGIKYIELGVETFNDNLLRENKKPATEKSIEEAANKIKEAGAVFIPNIIIGLPGETKGSYQNTLDFIKRHKDNISHMNIYNLALYEGTELADNIDAKIDADLNENVVTKSFHKNPEVHKKFAADIYKQAMELLDKTPVNLKGEKTPPKSSSIGQADKMFEDIKLVVEVEPKPGTEKAFKKQAEAKVKKINEILNESQGQKHITPFQDKVIRGRIEKVVGGTQFQMKEALKYVEKIVKNSEFRAKEEQKYKDIAKIDKERKGLFDKKSKYKRIKEIFNVAEAEAVVDEYMNIKKEDLITMDAQDVSNLLSELKSAKSGLREKAQVKTEARQAKVQGWVDKAFEVLTPIKYQKHDKGCEAIRKRYVEEGTVDRRVEPKKTVKMNTFDTNLTSIFSRFAAKSLEPGKVGKDWLNKELYYGKLIPAERNYKKQMKATSDKVLDYIKKEYGKSARDVMNDLYTETVDITIDVKTKKGIKKEVRRISKEEAIKWHMLLQDATLYDRIFEPLTLDKSGNLYKGNGFTDKTIAELNAALTPKDKRLSEFLFKEYQGARERYNVFMRDKFGVGFPDNPFYSNIYSEYFDKYQGLNVEDMMKGNPIGTLKSNNIISRVSNKNTIKDAGAISAYFDYIDKMEWMYQFTEPLEMYRGIFSNKKVRRQIEVYHGKAALKLIDDYEKVIIRDLRNISEKNIDQLTKNFANAALGLNPNITIKQLFSITASMTEVDVLQFTNEMKNFFIDAAKAVTDKDNIVRKLINRDAITMRGDVGLGMDVFLILYARRNKLATKPIFNAVLKVARGANKAFGKTIEYGDKAGAVVGSYVVFKTRYKDYIKKGHSPKEAEQMAFIDSDRFIDATQQSMSMFNTSVTRFKAGSLGRAATAFTSGPAQFLRMEMNMWRNVYTGITKKGQFKNKEVLKNLARIAVIRQAIPAMYQFAADGWEFDAQNQAATFVLSNAYSVFALGKVAAKLKNKLQGLDYEVSIMPAIDNMQNLVVDVLDLVDITNHPYLYTDKEKVAIYQNTAIHLGLFVGVPIRSIKNIATGDVKNFFDGAKSDREEIAEEAVRTGMSLESTIVDAYGEDFLYDEDGKIRRSTRSYIEEYVYQVNKDTYGKFSDEIKRVMGMRKNEDIKKYLIRKGRHMNELDFDLMMQYMSEDNPYGDGQTIRFISKETAEYIKNRVAEDK